MSATHSPPNRISALDMTKGGLVVLMVIYHTLNYSSEYYLAFRYLSFLPLSFLLITGFLLSHVYSARYATDKRGLIRRLLLRGCRLIALFTCLNIVAQFARSPAYQQSGGGSGFFRHWEEIFVSGGSRFAAFEVLLPIAYLILLSPLLIALANRHASFLPVITVLSITVCAFLDHQGATTANLVLVTPGLVGMLAGQLLSNLVILERVAWLSLLMYAAYFPLGMTKGYVYLVQLLGACIAVALLVGIGVKAGARGWWQERVIRLGQYSLLAYIIQIGILQMFSRAVGRPDPLSITMLALFVATLVLMTLLIEITDWMRTRSSGAERLYKAVFA